MPPRLPSLLPPRRSHRRTRAPGIPLGENRKRTMGATRGQILRIFFLNGAALGVAGTVLGVGGGIAFAANIDSIRVWLESLTDTALFPAEIRFLSQLPSRTDPTEVVIVAAMAIGLSFLATIYPAWRAARLDPVEALRYE